MRQVRDMGHAAGCIDAGGPAADRQTVLGTSPWNSCRGSSGTSKMPASSFPAGLIHCLKASLSSS